MESKERKTLRLLFTVVAFHAMAGDADHSPDAIITDARNLGDQMADRVITDFGGETLKEIFS